MAEYNINKFSYGGNTYKLEDNRITDLNFIYQEDGAKLVDYNVDTFEIVASYISEYYSKIFCRIDSTEVNSAPFTFNEFFIPLISIKPVNNVLTFTFSGVYDNYNVIVTLTGPDPGTWAISFNDLGGNVWYGTSTTAAATAAKVATTSTGDFVLATGNMIRVKFTNANSYNGTATLNIDGTGAINIARVGTTVTTRYYWTSGEVVDFIYDGTNFVMSNKGTATTTYYGLTKLSSSTSSTSTALAATPSAVKAAYDLANSKSEVSVSQTLTTGTEIGSVTINGTSTSLYAPNSGSTVEIVRW